MAETTASRRLFPLSEAQAALREMAAEVERAFSDTPPTNPEARRALARRLVSLEMGAQALGIADLEERKKAR